MHVCMHHGAAVSVVTAATDDASHTLTGQRSGRPVTTGWPPVLSARAVTVKVDCLDEPGRV